MYPKGNLICIKRGFRNDILWKEAYYFYVSENNRTFIIIDEMILF